MGDADGGDRQEDGKEDGCEAICHERLLLQLESGDCGVVHMNGDILNLERLVRHSRMRD